MKYSTSISEQELSAYLAQTTQVVVVQQKKMAPANHSVLMCDRFIEWRGFVTNSDAV